MYEGSQSVIELLEQQNKTSLSKGEIVMVFKKIIEDSEKMGERMTHLETRITSLEEKVDKALEKIDKISEIVSKKPPTLFEKIIALKDHKLFWYTLWISLMLLGCFFGVPATSFNGLFGLFIGG